MERIDLSNLTSPRASRGGSSRSGGRSRSQAPLSARQNKSRFRPEKPRVRTDQRFSSRVDQNGDLFR